MMITPAHVLVTVVIITLFFVSPCSRFLVLCFTALLVPVLCASRASDAPHRDKDNACEDVNEVELEKCMESVNKDETSSVLLSSTDCGSMDTNARDASAQNEKVIIDMTWMQLTESVQWHTYNRTFGNSLNQYVSGE